MFLQTERQRTHDHWNDFILYYPLRIDRSTSCDLEAGNDSNSTKRPCSAGQGRSPRLGGTPSNSMSLWEYHTALGTPPRLQISFPIQKSIKMLKFLSAILFPMVLGAPWTDFDDPGLFEKLSFSTFRQCFFVVECLRGFLSTGQQRR